MKRIRIQILHDEMDPDPIHNTVDIYALFLLRSYLEEHIMTDIGLPD